MKIAFQIERKNYYRLLGPLIDESLRREWTVECWHDYNQPKKGSKGYEFPAIESAPQFFHGTPAFKTYAGPGELKEYLRQNSVDVIVSLFTPAYYFGAPLTAPAPAWVSIQHVSDFFWNNRPECVLSADMNFIYSTWWFSQGLKHYHLQGMLRPGDPMEAQLAARVRALGFPEMDQCRFLNPREVRNRWNIPDGKPVVVYLPFIPDRGFWSHAVFPESNRLKQLLHCFRYGQFSYWNAIMKGWNERSLAGALRSFCDRNNAYLVVKGRLKSPIPSYLEDVADQCLYDERHYPATILEALSIASLCISFFSTTVTEAVYMGVPNLCITHAMKDKYVHNQELYQLWRETHEGSLYRFAGAAAAMSVPEAITRLPGTALSEFRLDAHARESYVKKYLGYDDGMSSARILDTMQTLCLHSLKAT